MGFYNEGPYKSFRFGDILKDFLTVEPTINNPISELSKAECRIDISSGYYVLLSPCCSIDESILLLSLLVEIKKPFYKNAYFADDMTRVNLEIPPDKSMSPEDWNKLSQDEKNKRMGRGDAYTNLEFFVYENNGLLPEYKLIIRGNKIPNPPYMIDFRKTFFVKCDKIRRDQKDIPIEVKLLELSVETRETLRNKLSHFYGRRPPEDEAYLI